MRLLETLIANKNECYKRGVAKRVGYKMKLIFLLTVFSLASCLPVKPHEMESYNLKGIADKRTAHSSPNITVCFERMGDYNQQMISSRAALAAFVKSEFDKTNVKLLGWEECKSFESYSEYDGNIRISFVGPEKFPSRSRFAQSNLGSRGGHERHRREFEDYTYLPTLTVNVSRWKETNKLGDTRISATNGNTFLHELGHAVGLVHEHIREGSCSTYGDIPEASIAKKMGDEEFKESYATTEKYDPNSIMDYCNVLASNRYSRALGISSKDIETINMLYPSPEEISDVSSKDYTKSTESKDDLIDWLNP